MSLPFPNVPALPGVPPIPRLPGLPSGVITALDDVQAVNLWISSTQGPSWGIFDSNNNQVLFPDSILDFDFRKEYTVADYPIQAGGFANYDKVNRPFETAVRMSKGGSQSDRTAFLNQLEAIAGDTNLYVIVTPEKPYTNCNITRVEVSRKGVAGAYFIEADVFFLQIRQSTAQYSSTSANTQNAQQPSAQPVANIGTVQPQPPTASAVSGLYAQPNNVANSISQTDVTAQIGPGALAAFNQSIGQ